PHNLSVRRRVWAPLFVLSALGACRAREAAVRPAPAPPERTLTRRLFAEPGTLNAVLPTDVPEQLVLAYVSGHLSNSDSSVRLVPGVAERIDASPDGLAYTIPLRSDAVWEDGPPVTPADAVFTIRKVADPATPSPLFKPLFEDLASAEEVS